MNDLRGRFLQLVYKMFPFTVAGDAKVSARSDKLLSCIIPTYNRPFELTRVLSSLAEQDMNDTDFEIIIIEDGGSTQTEDIVRSFSAFFTVRHVTTKIPVHSLGMLRNRGLELAAGKYILFLDDDTLILQEFFLRRLCEQFEDMPNVDCILIPGESDRCFLNDKYAYFNKYSFGGACIAYTRNVLAKLSGFYDDMSSYEDIELALRFYIIHGKMYRERELIYYHPPSYFMSWHKPMTNGVSFLQARKRYSFGFWFVCYLNALRFLPLLLFSPLSKKCRHWGMISAGFLVGPFVGKIRGFRSLRYK